MLGKLLKDELKSYCFPMGVTFLAGLVFTIFMKILCMIPYPSEAKEMIQVFGGYGYYYLIMLIGTAASVFAIVRFYSTMVGDRGYLTWTLPVSSETHIWSKLIGATIWDIAANIVIFLLLILFLVGDYWAVNTSELADGFEEMFQFIADSFKIQYIPAVIFAIISIIVWSLVSLLIVYLCIAIGQLFGKWRILASVGAYFVVILLFQIFIVIGMVGIMVGIASVVEFWDTLINSMEWSPTAIVTGGIAIFALIGVGIDAILFVITNNIFKKHLNLE